MKAVEASHKISVIIPVYNAKAFLPGCVDSILSQTYANIELILVDDGSTDGSGDVCDRLALRDDRVRVVHQRNGGASSARNTGIRTAAGEYILFVDSDDRIKPGSLQAITDQVALEGERDVTFLKAMSVYPDRSMAQKDVYDKDMLYGRDHEQVLKYLSAMVSLPVCVWGKLIRRQVLTDNSVFFMEGIILEDVDFCIHLYLNAKSYNYINTDYYYYTEDRPGSVMSVHTHRKYYDLLTIINKWVSLSITDYMQYNIYVKSMLAFQYCMLLGMYGRLPKEAKRTERENMRSLAWLLGSSVDFRVKVLHRVFRLTGIGGVSRLMAFYEKLKDRRCRRV